MNTCIKILKENTARHLYLVCIIWSRTKPLSNVLFQQLRKTIAICFLFAMHNESKCVHSTYCWSTWKNPQFIV